jgi:predicted phage terminase large subunit-like protein
VAKLTDRQAESLLHDWSFCAREDQLAPEGDWQSWLFLAGRGAGKTRAGAEWVRGKVKSGCGRIGMIAPTAADVRDVMVEGPSGVLAVSWEHDRDNAGNLIGRPIYESSKRRLTWENGATAATFSAEEPDRLRGPQHSALWCDELAAWQDPAAAWDMAMFGLRIGTNPQAMISTTPRPIPIIRELLRDPTCVATRATTWDNRGNLARTFIGKIVSKYKGTRLGRQELLGELIEESEGALWTRAMIDAALLKTPPPDMTRIVVAIDPAVTANEMSSLTGIVVAGLGRDGRGYVLEDLSGRYSPDAWARKAIDAFDRHKADRIVAEGNQGGDLVRHTITTVRPNAPVRIVHASRSKQARAEPIAALFEQGKVSFCGPFPELTDQLCTWEPLSGMPSPDRLDACVWALTSLMLDATEIPMTVPYVAGVMRNIPGQ